MFIFQYMLPKLPTRGKGSLVHASWAHILRITSVKIINESISKNVADASCVLVC